MSDTVIIQEIVYSFLFLANGNARVSGLTNVTNNNFDLESKMKRQSSVQASSSSSPQEETVTTPSSYPSSVSQSTPVHSNTTIPASPFRLIREESVDGTLSPVSLKGGMDSLDNDTTGRRKVNMTNKQVV